MRTEYRDLQFQLDSDNFNLDVNLYKDTLTLNLQDYRAKTFYTASYRNQNIGQEIHSKMGLEDVFDAFAKTQVDDYRDMRNEDQEISKILHIEYGQVIKIQDVPCYKIEKGGVVTAYWVTMDKISRRDIIYQSKLKLSKMGELDQSQIQAKKRKMKNNRQMQDLSDKIKIKENENEALKVKIGQKEQQSIMLRQQLRRLKEEQNLINQRFQEKNALMNSQFQRKVTYLQDKITEMNQNHALQKKELVQKNKKLQQKITQLSQANQKLKQQKIKNSEKQKQRTDRNRSRSQGKKSQTSLNIYSSNFTIRGSQVQYKGSAIWTQYIFNQHIRPNETSRFSLKIIHTKGGNMLIGLVDSGEASNRSIFTSKSQAYVAYYGLNGYKYPENKQQGDGFSTGDIVQVVVNRTIGLVMYIVNGEMIEQWSQILSDKFKTFLPFFEVVEAGDTVQWLTD